MLSLLISMLILTGCGTEAENPEAMDEFAICLNENGAQMFGAEWCGHCKQQKEMFGDSFEKVNYVECTVEQATCLEADIKGYPTWKFADGSSAPGRQTFPFLAQKTGCALP